MLSVISSRREPGGGMEEPPLDTPRIPALATPSLPQAPAVEGPLRAVSASLLLVTIGTGAALAMLLAFPSENALFGSSLILFAAALLIDYCLIRLGWQEHLLAISFGCMYAFAYPGSGIVLHFSPDSAHPMLPSDADTLCFSLAVGSLGWLGFLWGYCTEGGFGRRAKAELAFADSAAGDASRLLWIGLVGIGFRTLVQLYSFYDNPDNFLNRGVLPSIIANLGMICTCALWHVRGKGYRTLALLVLLIYSLTGLFSGQRAEVFLPWLYLGCTMLCRSGLSRRELRNSLLFGSLLLGLIVVSYPVLTRFKLAMSSERIGTAGVERALEASVALGTAFDPYCDDDSGDEGLRDSALRVSTRFSHLQYGGNLVTRGHDELGWLWGSSLIDSVVVFVPRIVWPSKPTIGLGEQAYQLIGYEGAGSATVPISADWYLNFGLPGCFAGMFLIGRFYLALSRRLASPRALPRAFAAFLIYPLMIAGQGISGLVSVVVIHGVPVYLIQRFLLAPPPRIGRGNPQPATPPPGLAAARPVRRLAGGPPR